MEEPLKELKEAAERKPIKSPVCIYDRVVIVDPKHRHNGMVGVVTDIIKYRNKENKIVFEPFYRKDAGWGTMYFKDNQLETIIRQFAERQ